MEYIWWHIVEYILNPVFHLPPENVHSQLGKAKANFSHTQNGLWIMVVFAHIHNLVFVHSHTAILVGVGSVLL